MNSIYIEMVILATCFGVTLAAVWLNHKAQIKLGDAKEALKQVLKEKRDLEIQCNEWRQRAEIYQNLFKNNPKAERYADVEQANT